MPELGAVGARFFASTSRNVLKDKRHSFRVYAKLYYSAFDFVEK
jgi:hypothetical protein